MNMGLNIGIDLCDDHLAIYVSGEDKVSIWPTVICREKNKEKWHIGEEAYRQALSGKGVLTDKLISLLLKDGRSTVSGRTYTAEELCANLLGKAISEAIADRDISEIENLCLALHEPLPGLMDSVSKALLSIGIKEKAIRLISHSEAFIRYMLSKDKELYNNTVGLFDLSEGSLSYYEFRMIRGLSLRTVICNGTDMEEAFHLDILRNESGRKLADHILAECARKLMEKKIFSSVFLTGKGFEELEWAEEFKEFICRRRRVIYEDGIFARGAALAAELCAEGGGEDELLLCDTRIPAEISMDVSVEGRPNRLILAAAGTPWYGYTAHAEFIPQGQTSVDIDVNPVDRHIQKQRKTVELSAFPERPDRCTRVSMDMKLGGARRAELCFRDLGFGEFFPGTDTEIRSEIEF